MLANANLYRHIGDLDVRTRVHSFNLIFFSLSYQCVMAEGQLDSDVRSTALFAPLKITDACSSIAAIASIRLPGFWWHSPLHWFIHAEVVFTNHRVTSDSTGVNHVLATLDEEDIRMVADLLGPNASFYTIHCRLIDAYDIPHASRFQEIVQPGGIGDRCPSQLLCDMRMVLPEGIGEIALKEFWFQKLSASVRTIAASLDCPLDSLTAREDRVLDAWGYQHVDALTVTNERVTELNNAILTLTQQVQVFISLDRNSPRTSKSSYTPRQCLPQIRSTQHVTTPACYYHARYDDVARNCSPPCSFRPTEN